MRRQRWLMLALISFVMISLTVLSSASWFIVFRRNQAVDFQYVQADTSPYFTTGETYNGEEQPPTLTKAGEALYGADFAYTVEWQSGVRADGTTAISKTQDAAYLGKAAGKHYYKIVDSKTGQVICQNHEVSIAKANLTATNVTLNTLALPGVAVPTHDFTWTGVNGESFRTTELTGVTAPKNFSYAQIIYPVEETVTFDSADVAANSDLAWHYNNYNTASAKVTYKVVATCYSYTGGTATYHGSLDQALDSTKDNTAATTVVAMQSFTANSTTYTANPNATSGIKFTHTISDGKTIGKNVTFLIPYSATTTFNASESTLNRKGTTMSPTCVNKVTAGNLTNNGTITIGGVLGKEGAGTSGATSGSYAMLYMNAGKTMTSTGDLNVFGYITNGGGTTNPAQIKANSGLITMPFVIYDYNGGQQTIGLFKGDGGGVSPFVIFDMPNIHAKLTCKGGSSGAKIKGYADLYTGAVSAMGITIPAQHNNAELNIFSSANALINMTSGEAVFWHKPTQGANFGVTDSTPNLAAETDIILKGDTTTGNLSLTVTVAIITETVSLTSVNFPISHKLNLTLDGDYDYTFMSAFKFMPGSVLNIGEEANVVVDSGGGLLFYDAYSKDDGGTRLSYYNQVTTLKTYYKNELTSPAQCNLAGSLTVNGAIGGNIIPTAKGAFLDLSGARVLTMSEVEGNGSWSASGILGSSRGGEFAHIYTETQIARGRIYDGSQSADNTSFSSNPYYAMTPSGATSLSWRQATAGSITLNAGGGKFGTADSITENVFFDDGGKMLTPFALLTQPTWRDHRVSGWAENGTQLSDPSAIQAGDTITAVWENMNQIELTITDPGGTVSGPELVFIDEYYETVYVYDAYCMNAKYAQYLSSWTLTLTHQTDSSTITFNLQPGELFSPNELATQFPDGADTNPANYTYSLTPNMEAKDVVTLNITSNNKVTGTTVKVYINGVEASYSNNTVYIRHQDNLSVEVTTKGAHKSGILNRKYYTPTITINGESTSGDSSNTAQQTITLSQQIALEEDGTTTVTISCTGS